MAEIDIGKIFSDFSEEIKSQIDKELKTIARETVSELNATSLKKSGDFARGWRYLKERGSSEIRITISNRKKWQLTHLLESGHKNRDEKTNSRAFPHVAPANERAQKKFREFMGDK
jgi:hypothetical protein|nr:MAG TPA: putative tail component [Caudoviricetes sp.]